MYRICPKCQRSRFCAERIAEKDGKRWLIEYCGACDWNFEITDLPPLSDINKPTTNRKARRFKFNVLSDEEDDQ